MASAVEPEVRLPSTAPAVMEGQLALLRKKLRVRHVAKRSGLTQLPPSPPGSASQSPQASTRRVVFDDGAEGCYYGHSSAPPCFLEREDSPQSPYCQPHMAEGRSRSALPMKGSRLMPRRVASTEGTGGNRRSSSASSFPAGTSTLQPTGSDEPRPRSDGGSRPPLPKRGSASVGRSVKREAGAGYPHTVAAWNETSPRGGPVESPRRGRGTADVRDDAPPVAQPVVQGPKFVDCGGWQIPGGVFIRICSFIPIPTLPAFRRICLCCHRALGIRLQGDGVLRSALDGHLEQKRLRSKRVWVIVRARPQTEAFSCISIDRNKVSVAGAGNSSGSGTSFFFDRAFGGSATQEEVCSYVGDQVMHHALNGEHLCLLAYGQTGSGKTHTMFGSLEAGANQGLAFHAMSRLATLLRSNPGASPPSVELSFMEVYNDNLYDLLDGSRMLPKQRSSDKHVVPQGLTRRRCELNDMEKQVHTWLCEGAATRMVGKTVFNPRSSRSHAVVMLHICWGYEGKPNRLRLSRPLSGTKETRIYIVDLAGSERAGLYAMAPEQLKEGEHINLSLSALGRVVSALAGGKCEHVPYRDSALTWLLKDAITGTSARVCMVAAVHPAHAVETASTLRYARQYSTLQSSTSSLVPQLASEVRELQRKVDNLKRAFEKALANDEAGIQWTRESLQGTVHCQPRRNAKDLFEIHPHLSWTSAHQSKAAVRGQRRDRSSIGYTRAIEEVPPPRDPSEKPDGRPVSLNASAGTGSSDPPDRCVEVVYEGRHGRPPVVLWYPESSLEMVQPPRTLLDALEKLDREEAELARKKAELQKFKEEGRNQQEEWMKSG